MNKIELTIEVEQSHERDWQAVIKTDSIILWRSKYKPSAAEAFRVAAKLVGDMPADFFFAAQNHAAMRRYVQRLEPR